MHAGAVGALGGLALLLAALLGLLLWRKRGQHPNGTRELGSSDGLDLQQRRKSGHHGGMKRSLSGSKPYAKSQHFARRNGPAHDLTTTHSTANSSTIPKTQQTWNETDDTIVLAMARGGDSNQASMNTVPAGDSTVAGMMGPKASDADTNDQAREEPPQESTEEYVRSGNTDCLFVARSVARRRNSSYVMARALYASSSGLFGPFGSMLPIVQHLRCLHCLLCICLACVCFNLRSSAGQKRTCAVHACLTSVEALILASNVT